MYCKCTAKCTEPTCSLFRFGVQATHRKRARKHTHMELDLPESDPSNTNLLHASRSLYPSGQVNLPSLHPAHARPAPESRSHGRAPIDPRVSGETFFQQQSTDPAQHPNGEESYYNDHRQFYDDSGPPPYSPYKIPANSEHPALGEGKFSTPSSTQLRTSTSAGPQQSLQSDNFSNQQRASSALNACSVRQESLTASDHQALYGQRGSIMSERVLVPANNREEQQTMPKAPSPSPSWQQKFFSTIGLCVSPTAVEIEDGERNLPSATGTVNKPTAAEMRAQIEIAKEEELALLHQQLQ
jgi:hypothetical protein